LECTADALRPLSQPTRPAHIFKWCEGRLCGSTLRCDGSEDHRGARAPLTNLHPLILRQPPLTGQQIQFLVRTAPHKRRYLRDALFCNTGFAIRGCVAEDLKVEPAGRAHPEGPIVLASLFLQTGGNLRRLLRVWLPSARRLRRQSKWEASLGRFLCG